MEILEIGLVWLAFGVTAGTFMWLQHFANIGRGQTWCLLMKSLGLTDAAYTASWIDGSGSVTARQADLRVSIHESRSKEEPSTRVEVTGLKLRGLTLRLEDFDTALVKMLPGPRELELGDPAFDSTFYIGGPPPVALALLDARARRGLVGLAVAGRVDLGGSALRVRVNGGSANVEAALRQVLEIAEHIHTRHAIVPCLVENVLHDPEPLLRLQSVRTLAREYRKHPEAEETLRAACQDRNLEVRLQAATALGKEAFPVLLEIATSGAADDCVAEAIVGLGDELEEAQAHAILARSLKAGRIDTARGCLARLGRSQARTATEALAKVLAVQEGELAIAAAEALASSGAGAAEAPLQRALGRGAIDVRIAVAEALGRVGTVDSVLLLKGSAEREQNRDFRRAVRQAVAEIQSRTGASPGQLSIAIADMGQVSLVPEESGHLSLSDSDSDEAKTPGA